MISLIAQTRKNQSSNKLRQSGWVPAVIYGPKVRNQALQVESSAFDRVFAKTGESALISLKIKNSETKDQQVLALVHDLQKDPVTDKIIHVDFYAPRLDQTMHVTIPLVFEGWAGAVVDLDGTLVKNIQEVEIEVLPKDLPHEIKVDISCLRTFEDKIFIKDLKIPTGVKILADAGEVIALVMPPRSEEELAALGEAPEEKVEEIEKVGEQEEEIATAEQAEESEKSEKNE